MKVFRYIIINMLALMFIALLTLIVPISFLFLLLHYIGLEAVKADSLWVVWMILCLWPCLFVGMICGSIYFDYAFGMEWTSKKYQKILDATKDNY